MWHVADQNSSQLYLHCPQNTSIHEIHGNTFFYVNSDCTVKTETQVLQTYKNSRKNITFDFMQEEDISFDLRQISNLKKDMIKSSKMNISEDPLSLNLKNLKLQMEHFQFKKRMITFHHNSMFIVVPLICACFVALLIAIIILCLKKNHTQQS